MKFSLMSPPKESGIFKNDIPRLYDWCKSLYKKLQVMFSCIENEQIVSVSADKLTSDFLFISKDSFRLGNSTDYIEFKDGKLIVVSTADSATASEEM